MVFDSEDMKRSDISQVTFLSSSFYFSISVLFVLTRYQIKSFT